MDPLIVNVWPLAQGTSTNYTLYEDSGVAEQYQRSAFTRTPIKATQSGDTLRVEVGPVEGSFPGMSRRVATRSSFPRTGPPRRSP